MEIAECDDLTDFKYYGTFDKFFNVNSFDHRPEFSGKMRYTFNVDINKNGEKVFIDLGRVGQNAELYVNGEYCGIRITAPYLFDITNAVIGGQNKIVAVVSNTLAQRVRDKFSRYLQLSPSGLLGGRRIKYFE